MPTTPDDPARPQVAADAQGTPQATPAPGRPGSLPFTPYGGTTAPYRPKAETASKPRAATFSCTQCKASGFATRPELDGHVRSAHPEPGATPAEDAAPPGGAAAPPR